MVYTGCWVNELSEPVGTAGDMGLSEPRWGRFPETHARIRSTDSSAARAAASTFFRPLAVSDRVARLPSDLARVLFTRRASSRRSTTRTVAEWLRPRRTARSPTDRPGSRHIRPTAAEPLASRPTASARPCSVRSTTSVARARSRLRVGVSRGFEDAGRAAKPASSDPVCRISASFAERRLNICMVHTLTPDSACQLAFQPTRRRATAPTWCRSPPPHCPPASQIGTGRRWGSGSRFGR